MIKDNFIAHFNHTSVEKSEKGRAWEISKD